MNALKTINARVKQLQKKHPKSKRTTLQKQAGREWKSGKLKNKKKAAPKKAAKRKPAKRKAAPRKKSVRKTVRRKKRVTVTSVLKKHFPKRRRKARKAAPRRRARVSGTGSSNLLPIAALAIGGVLLYKFMSTPQVPAFTNTSNPYRVQTQNSILQWATAAGLGISAITQLINAINNASDSQVAALAAGAPPAGNGADVTQYLQSWGITAG